MEEESQLGHLADQICLEMVCVTEMDGQCEK